jgi:hypothetical protein
LALKHALVKETEGSFFLSDHSSTEDVNNCHIEIARQYLNVPVNLSAFFIMRGLGFLELSDGGNTLSIFLTEEEMSEPLRIAFQNQLCRPSIRLRLVLWAGKAVYVSTMLSDLDEDSKILLDEFCFVLRPDSTANAPIAASFAASVRRQIGK